jgi:hypothetical protein
MTFDLPTVVLIVLMVGFVYTVWHISKGHRINFADMFKGEDGKASAGRFIALGAWVFCTWVLVKDSQDSNFSVEYALGYLGICIAGYAANKATDAYKAKLESK